MTGSNGELLERLLRTVPTSKTDFDKVREENADRIPPEPAGQAGVHDWSAFTLVGRALPFET